MKAVIADTGPLYALLDPDDAYHSRARSELARLQQQGVQLLASGPTMCEAYTLVLRRLGTDVARRWLKQVRTGCGFVSPQQRHYDEAAARLCKLPDQPITLFDALLAELAAELDVAVWSYDHHLDLLGCQLWR